MATILQTKVFKSVVNGSEKITKAMSKAGYAVSTSKRTNKVTRTKGWKELMDKHLPDSELAKVHKELLHKREIHIIKSKEGEEAEVIDQPETQAASKALDMAYKLKNHYPASPEQSNIITPQPILNVLFIDNRNKESMPDDQENTGSAGGNERIKDSINNPLLNSLSPVGQKGNSDKHSK